jgi:hypothetical protein
MNMQSILFLSAQRLASKLRSLGAGPSGPSGSWTDTAHTAEGQDSGWVSTLGECVVQSVFLFVQLSLYTLPNKNQRSHATFLFQGLSIKIPESDESRLLRSAVETDSLLLRQTPPRYIGRRYDEDTNEGTSEGTNRGTNKGTSEEQPNHKRRST